MCVLHIYVSGRLRGGSSDSVLVVYRVTQNLPDCRKKKKMQEVWCSISMQAARDGASVMRSSRSDSESGRRWASVGCVNRVVFRRLAAWRCVRDLAWSQLLVLKLEPEAKRLFLLYVGFVSRIKWLQTETLTCLCELLKVQIINCDVSEKCCITDMLS